jgi:hypothetical protein
VQLNLAPEAGIEDGRRAAWVCPLAAAACLTTASESWAQRIATGESRISEPLAADSSSGSGSCGSPVRSNLANWLLVVPPMSKHRPGGEKTALPPASLIKQHPFCKSGFSEVGHLASMVR